MRLFSFILLISSLFSSVSPQCTEKGKITLHDQILNVEIAESPEDRAYGLMGRDFLSDGEGMLFVFPRSERLTFWMKNTLIPLSIAFFDKENTLIHIADMDPPTGDVLIKYRSPSPCLYALEVPKGWFSKHGIGPGVKFSFHDPLNQVR